MKEEVVNAHVLRVTSEFYSYFPNAEKRKDWVYGICKINIDDRPTPTTDFAS